jgi:hypothetical protein
MKVIWILIFFFGTSHSFTVLLHLVSILQLIYISNSSAKNMPEKLFVFQKKENSVIFSEEVSVSELQALTESKLQSYTETQVVS